MWTQTADAPLSAAFRASSTVMIPRTTTESLGFTSLICLIMSNLKQQGSYSLRDSAVSTRFGRGYRFFSSRVGFGVYPHSRTTPMQLGSSYFTILAASKSELGLTWTRCGRPRSIAWPRGTTHIVPISLQTVWIGLTVASVD